MAGHSRYNITNKKAGIERGVLKNKLRIFDQKQLDDAEAILLADAYEFFLSKENPEKINFDVEFLFSIHKYFLSTLYEWAGNKRKVNLSKGKMMFASVDHLDLALKYLDDILKKNLPKKKETKNNIAYKIAFIHNEYNAIHPFRDGNGRTIRLFLDLLVLSAGYEMIDWDSKSKNEYMKACVSGAIGDHKPMTNFIFKRLYLC
ncbi:hypothetical protein A3B85_01730 [Candidatus Nomurabacteria bacterium RIFCSPHIGHO2_02_FULL_37_13]|uniref:protein adenylyltransferase n=1 Tax=Candidatus Nomurabacteria bacterium RIFCSPHIGHO2_02_FULL_37_13 TaxID=1801750 RepID=A0A1F6W638_9BACT|nr:MAG: hypothetical protein A2640_01655 [Candidatus Nomurabacteria bacterium RIFCSPHIGHO2_01_FULL_36_23]OGI77145.1 MAG: hypothetical protein A3B85_01730 [Candidatus Nomurabacteria bacterium RIFCSPHIGHO2_02_FULL_37_13]OGI88224.1 MAG: hypothetical protein A2906_01565 [Candidatus Nomurabacteria bacterium RIFCSPLOWO2_01_FULL_37_25]